MKTALKLTWAIMAHARVITSYQSPCEIGLTSVQKPSRNRVNPDQCTLVNKGVIIEILDFELGAFSENLKHLMTWRKGIFGFSLQKKKF